MYPKVVSSPARKHLLTLFVTLGYFSQVYAFCFYGFRCILAPERGKGTTGERGKEVFLRGGDSRRFSKAATTTYCGFTLSTLAKFGGE